MVPADRHLGGRDAVPDEHRGLDADRERPPAVDRAGPDEDRRRRVAVGQRDRDLDQPGRVRADLRRARRGRPRADAALRPAGAADEGGKRRRDESAVPAHAPGWLLATDVQLHTLWFIVVAFFWTGFFVLEGFDFGVGDAAHDRRPDRERAPRRARRDRPVLGRQRGLADRRRRGDRSRRSRAGTRRCSRACTWRCCWCWSR